MRAGKLRHRITIETLSAGVGDGMGGIVQDYTDYKTVWCSINPLSGTETTIAAQRGSEEDVRITMRYDSGVSPKCRLRQGDSTTYFDIVSVVNPEFRNKELILYCRMEQ